MTDEDRVFQTRTHLLYELKWLIYAADRFQQGRAGDPYVALIDSATVHARNLFEFAKKPQINSFTLASLGGTPRTNEPWDHWANNRVTHMTHREHDRAPWPADLDNERPDRLMGMADVVLDELESGGTSIPAGPVKQAFDEVVGAARTYWRDPSDANHDALQALYDDSRDNRTY